MQVTETLNEGLKRGYTVTVSAQELDGKVRLAFEPTGLRCSFELPLDRDRAAPTL